MLLRRALNRLAPVEPNHAVDFEPTKYQNNATTGDRAHMNPRQRWVLGIVGCFAITAIMFPPSIINLPNGMVVNGGFSFLFSTNNSLALVNTGLLGLELLVVGILGVVGWLITRDR